MKKGASTVDIGFGTGFPLIELSQRFGEQSQIYGIDIWEEGIKRTKEKIKVLTLKNIELLEESASQIKIEDNRIDLITSNLGVNNFAEKAKVYQEIKRILKKGGRLCITTNPIGTFQELFELFKEVMKEMGMKRALEELEAYKEHRKSKERIVEEFEEIGTTLVKCISDSTNMRFLAGEVLLNHSLIRIGFRESWEEMLGKKKEAFYTKLMIRINEIVEKEGAFKMTIPMLYLPKQSHNSVAFYTLSTKMNPAYSISIKPKIISHAGCAFFNSMKKMATRSTLSKTENLLGEDFHFFAHCLIIWLILDQHKPSFLFCN